MARTSRDGPSDAARHFRNVSRCSHRRRPQQGGSQSIPAPHEITRESASAIRELPRISDRRSRNCRSTRAETNGVQSNDESSSVKPIHHEPQKAVTRRQSYVFKSTANSIIARDLQPAPTIESMGLTSPRLSGFNACLPSRLLRLVVEIVVVGVVVDWRHRRLWRSR